MARKKRKREETGGSNWLTTYGDMVTLILAFFILLYSFSTIDIMKFQKMIFSFRGAVGIIDGGESLEEDKGVFSGQTMQDAGNSRKQTADIKKVAREIRAVFEDEGIEKEIMVEVNQRGVVISISEGFLFGRGEYELLPSGENILFSVGKILAEIPNDISAEGHADNTRFRVNSPIGNNWALSSLRASCVVAFLDSEVGLSPRRLQSVGFGDSRPIMPNDSEFHKQMNRRVDIVILSEKELL